MPQTVLKREGRKKFRFFSKPNYDDIVIVQKIGFRVKMVKNALKTNKFYIFNVKIVKN